MHQGHWKRVINLTVVVVIAGLGSSGARADTVLADPKAMAAEDAPERDARTGQAYPESRFGRPPSPPEIGIRRGFAVVEAEKMDADRAAEEGSRSPAGLVFNADEQTPSGAPKAQGRMPKPALPGSESGVPPVVGAVGPAAARTASPAYENVQPESFTKRTRGVQEIAVIANDLGFFPKTFFVTRDVPVRLFVTGASKQTLCIMMDAFQVRKQVRSQKVEEISFIPSQPGKYRFHCPMNGMEGTMIVKELSSAESQ